MPEELPRTTARLLISSAQVATSMADVLSGRSTGASRNAEGGAVRGDPLRLAALSDAGPGAGAEA